MHEDMFTRTAALLGEAAIDRLKASHVIVFGLGGVGGYVCEMLARCGVQKLTIVDSDTVSQSNLNRQIIALNSTVSRAKTDLIEERLRDINGNIKIIKHRIYFDDGTASAVDFSAADYVVDAIDSVMSKLLIIKKAKEFNIPIFSSMGTGRKLDPTKFQIADIKKTSVCPLAKRMRKILKDEGIEGVTVLFSTEEAAKTQDNMVASVPFVPSIAGILIARHVILELIK